MNLRHILIAALMISLPVAAVADKASRLNKRGIKSYHENNLEDSARQFTEALVERPDSPELRFNLGTALSATGQKEEAINELEKSAGIFERKENSAAAFFNAGNTSMDAGDLTRAIEFYKNALKLDQSSQDIRHNLEIAVRKLQQQQKQDQKDQKNNKQKNDSEDQEKNKQDQKQDQNKKDKEQQDKQKQEDADKKDRDRENKSQQQQQQERGEEGRQEVMTQQEALQLLNAIQDEEKKALALRKEKMREGMRVGDDW